MNKKMSILIGAVLLTAFGTLGAQEPPTTLNTAADWTKNANVSDVDGVLNVKKQTIIFSKKFDIDPNKKYTLSLSGRTVNMEDEKASSLVYAGFAVYAENGRMIGAVNSAVVAGTLTEVVEDAAKGATVIKIKDGSKFVKKYGVLAADAKEDLSDLPNFNIFGNVKDAVAKDNVWEVTLERPLAREIKAGTVVREHLRGGFLYTAGAKSIGKNWITMSGTITGMKKGSWYGKMWPAGAVKAQVVILANWTNKKLETQFKDISLTVK